MTRFDFGSYMMSACITRVFSAEEYIAVNDDAIARGFHRDDRRIFLPGMAWYTNWVFDPLHEWKRHDGKYIMIRSADSPNASHLSTYYWRDWADKRPPLCVVCPNGEQWEIDRTSKNGPGWTVTGTLPNITCYPSIVVPGYHGWLKNGQFSGDTEGRGPNGIARS